MESAFTCVVLWGPGSYTQGRKTEIPLGLLDKVQPSGDTILILGNSDEPDFKDIQLETSSFEELSLLTVGFQEILKSPIVGGGPSETEDDEDQDFSIPPPKHVLRRKCYNIVQHQYFDSFILMCIAVNCFFMAVTDPNFVADAADDKKGGILYFNMAFSTAQLIGRSLLYIFTLESMLKNLAYTPWGYFFGGDASWNRLDFFIVVVGWLEEYPDYLGAMPINLSFLRLFRCFRPLRTLGKIGGMKQLIETLFDCADQLVDVFNLTIFVFFVFSVLGMELFQGQGSQRCILPGENFEAEYPETSDWTLLPDEVTYPIEERRCGGEFQCPTIVTEDGTKLNYKCFHIGKNPDQDVTSQNQADGIIGYDNLGQAMLTVFVFCTLEGWVDGMYQFQDSFGWAVSTIYHILMILLGTFFCMNLALAVIADTFETAAAGDDDDDEDIDDDEQKGIVNDEDEDEEEERGGEIWVSEPENMLQKTLWKLSYNSTFNVFITVLIVLNAITLAMEHARRQCFPINTNNQAAGWSVGEGYIGPTPQNDSNFCIMQAAHMTTGLQGFLVGSNYFFVAAFAFECVVKMIGLNPKGYFQDPFNTFDFVIVAVSFLEIAIRIKGLTALRCFRLARVFKMARSWKSLRAIIESLLEVLPQMTSLTVMLILYMFIAAVAGMQMLGNKIPYTSRSRFTDFGSALLTVFQMLTGENWNEVMFESILTTKGYGIVVYFILIVLIGMFLVLNMFLAIMLSDFSCGEPPDFSLDNFVKTFLPFLTPKEDLRRTEEESVLEETQSMSNMFSPNQMKNHMTKEREEKVRSASAQRKEKLEKEGNKGSAELVKIQKDMKKQKKEEQEKKKDKLEGVALGYFQVDSPFRNALKRIVRNPLFDTVILTCIVIGSVLLAVNGPTNDDTTLGWQLLCNLEFLFVVVFTFEMGMKILVHGFYWCPDGYLKDPWNWLDFIVVWVGWLTNCLVPIGTSGDGVGALRTLRVLRVLRPLRVIQRLPGMRLVVAVLFECTPVFINICFVVFFFFTVFAIMGVQFFKGNFWYCNDEDVAFVDECYGCFPDEDERNPTGNCPAKSSEREWSNAPMNFDNTYISLLTLYEVAGLEMWLDVMYSSMDSDDSNCERRTAQGEKSPYGCNPQYEQRWYAAWYFVFFILIGVFIVLNLFVGAVVDKFNELKSENGGASPLQTEEQAKYSESMQLMVRMRPFRVALAPRKPRKNGTCVMLQMPWYKFRMICHRIVMWDKEGKGMGTYFDMLISLMVMLNIIIMGMYNWERLDHGNVMSLEVDCKNDDNCAVADLQKTKKYMALELLNTVFTFIFLVEMLLKFAAWGLRQYFMDYWNQLDFVLVVSSVLGFIVEVFLTSGAVPLNPAVFRIVRVARLTRALKSIRMVRRIKGVARLVDTLVIAIPAMANVASLCFLVIFIFAVMGMDFFGSDEIDGPNAGKVNGMYSQHANFRYFGDAFMLLFRAVTGEAWNGVMHDMMVAECDPSMYPDKDKIKPGDKKYDAHWCGTPHQSSPWIFFILFMVFVTGLLFELVTAIVLDEFSKMNENEKLPVNSDMIANFNDHWAQLDPKATQYIPQYKLLPFLRSVEPPIFDPNEEMSPEEHDKVAKEEVFKMSIVVQDVGGINMVHYVDTIVAVTRFQYLKEMGEEAGDTLDVTMIESPELTTRIVAAYPHLNKIENMPPKDFQQELSASRLQSAFYQKNAKKRMQKQKNHLKTEVTRIRGLKVSKTTNGELNFPEDVEQLSAAELTKEIKEHGGQLEMV